MSTDLRQHQRQVGAGRPSYHFIAPRGWMNDPCAPGYRDGVFHLFYQWQPRSHEWGDIAWGHATSTDLLRWVHDENPVLVPDAPYDDKGIFTGCLLPSSGSTGLTVAYTSVTKLPFHYTLPHPRGAEGVSLATSHDGGRTWHKHSGNPVIAEEPDVHVTGFRDPFVTPWRVMDAARGASGGQYALLSGGIGGNDGGPRVFLYDASTWAYIFPILRVPRNTRIGPVDLGANLECTSLVELGGRDVLITGTEGGAPRGGGTTMRYAAWLLGSVTPSPGADPEFVIEAGGMLDWGQWYAPAPLRLPDGRTVVWGWIIDEELSPPLAAAKGWSGCLGVPREVVLKDGRVGIRPLGELETLRIPVEAAEAPLACEIELVADGPCNLVVREGGGVHTEILYTGSRIVVRRPPLDGANTADEEGDFSLAEGEQLTMRVFLDHDVLEIFANERFALATRVYAPCGARGVRSDAKITIWELRL